MQMGASTIANLLSSSFTAPRTPNPSLWAHSMLLLAEYVMEVSPGLVYDLHCFYSAYLHLLHCPSPLTSEYFRIVSALHDRLTPQESK